MKRSLLWLIATSVVSINASAESRSEVFVEAPIIVEEPRGSAIADLIDEKSEAFFNQASDAIATKEVIEDELDEDGNIIRYGHTNETYHIDKAHIFVTREENLIDYPVLNSTLDALASSTAEKSKFLKTVNLDVSSNIGGSLHKTVVDTLGTKAAAFLPFSIDFDLGGELTDLAANPLAIRSVDVGFGVFQSPLSPRTLAGLSYVNKIYLDFDLGLDTLTLVNRALEADLVVQACSEQGRENLVADLPELAPAVEQACLLAKNVVEADDFKQMITDIRSQIDELDKIVNEAIEDMIAGESGAIATLLRVATGLSVHTETCEAWKSWGWWTYPLPEWHDWNKFEFTGCKPSLQIDIKGGAVVAGGKSSIHLSEDKLRVDLNVALNDNSMGLATEDGLNEFKAEAMAYYWTAMKTVESFSAEEVEYSSEELAEIFDSAVGYLVESFADDAKDELNYLD